MTTITLQKLDNDIQEIKVVLHKLTHLLEEDFELADEVKKELKHARKEPLAEYVDHHHVLKEFA